MPHRQAARPHAGLPRHAARLQAWRQRQIPGASCVLAVQLSPKGTCNWRGVTSPFTACCHGVLGLPCSTQLQHFLPKAHMAVEALPDGREHPGLANNPCLFLVLVT